MNPEILIIREPISADALHVLAENWHGFVVKGVADIERNTIALGGEWHVDANVKLIEDGSSQEYVWGFNIYPDKTGVDALEFFSLINIRPAQGNRGQEVLDPIVREKIRTLVARLLPSLKL